MVIFNFLKRSGPTDIRRGQFSEFCLLRFHKCNFLDHYAMSNVNLNIPLDSMQKERAKKKIGFPFKTRTNREI